MRTIKQRVAKIAAPSLGCSHQEVLVRAESIVWLQRLKPFRVVGGTQYPAGLLVVMPNGQLTPPLILATMPVWEQHVYANAILRVEGYDLRTIHPEYTADICRTTLAGPGSHVATVAHARRELRDPALYDYVFPYLLEPSMQTRGKRWLAVFTSVAPDGALERWKVAGYDAAISQAECELLLPTGTWPLGRR